MRHPEVVEVFQTSNSTQPRLAEPLKGVPAHPLFVQSHFDKSGCEPAVFEIVVKMRCASCCVEQQTELPGCVASQELCNVRVQIDFSLRSSGFEVLHDARTILGDLVLDLDGASIVDKVAGLKG